MRIFSSDLIGMQSRYERQVIGHAFRPLAAARVSGKIISSHVDLDFDSLLLDT